MPTGAQIPIEERDGAEITQVQGRRPDGAIVYVQVTPDGSKAANPAFDVTQARLITGLITEQGICEASEISLRRLFTNLKVAESGD